MGEAGSNWLGMTRDGDRWSLPVTGALVSGADALFGGCATAAAIAIGTEIAPQPVIYVSTHFGALAKRDSTVEITARTISTGRTMTHLEITGTADGRDAFTSRVTAGHRPTHDAAGQWVAPPAVTDPTGAPPFDHPVHEGTWGERFEWRLAGSSTGGDTPWAAWWVRAREPMDLVIEAAILCDYVTYGMGRALQRPMGGLSVDNCLRLHDTASAATSEWLLLQVVPEAISGGFGQGVARLFSGRTLVAQGSQSVVMNNWDWRLPCERDGSEHDTPDVDLPRRRFRGPVVNARDAVELARFYAALLDWSIKDSYAADGASWAIIESPSGGLKMEFQGTADYVAPVWPNADGEQQMTMHIDVAVEVVGVHDDPRPQFFALVEHAVALGARRADHQPQPDRIMVMIDPAGHPFCLVPAPAVGVSR